MKLPPLNVSVPPLAAVHVVKEVAPARTSWPWTTLIEPEKPLELPVNVSVSLAVFTTAPGPLSARFMLVLSARSRTRTAAAETATAPARLPLVPPLPSWSVPAEIVVPPLKVLLPSKVKTLGAACAGRPCR